MPDLPEFQLSLHPDEYELPEIDPAWDSKNWETLGQPLKEHLRDSDENPTDWYTLYGFLVSFLCVVKYMFDYKTIIVQVNITI